MRKQMEKVADEILDDTFSVNEVFEDTDVMYDWVVTNAPNYIERYLASSGFIQSPDDVMVISSDYSNEDWGDGVIKNIGFDVYPVGQEPEFHPSGRADSPLFYVTVNVYYWTTINSDDITLDRIDIVDVNPQNEG